MTSPLEAKINPESTFLLICPILAESSRSSPELARLPRVRWRWRRPGRWHCHEMVEPDARTVITGNDQTGIWLTTGGPSQAFTLGDHTLTVTILYRELTA